MSSCLNHLRAPNMPSDVMFNRRHRNYKNKTHLLSGQTKYPKITISSGTRRRCYMQHSSQLWRQTSGLKFLLGEKFLSSRKLFQLMATHHQLSIRGCTDTRKYFIREPRQTLAYSTLLEKHDARSELRSASDIRDFPPQREEASRKKHRRLHQIVTF